MKKISAILFAISMILATIPAQVLATTVEDFEGTFAIHIVDENGTPISNANISLYSYLDGRVVASAVAGETGSSVFNYIPELNIPSFDSVGVSQESKEDIVYGDYIVYVSKDGYETELYYLTKIYSANKHDFADVNSEEVTITMVPARQNTVTSTPVSIENEESNYQQQVYEYLVQSEKIDENHPIYVMRDEDREALEKAGILSPKATRGITHTYQNVSIPIGEFHVCPGAEVDVTFKTSDKIKVQSAVNSGSGFSASGGISRSFETIAQYPTLTSSANEGQKSTYYTRGNFVDEETYIVGGQVRIVRRLDSIHGSVESSRKLRCDTCMKPFGSVMSGYGNASQIPSGGLFTQIRNKTVDLGLSAAVNGVSLGVTRITGSSTEVKYTPTGGKSLRIYDMDSKYRAFHITHS